MYRCTHALNLKNDSSIWASARQNLSSGFPTKRDSNKSPQLQRHATCRNYACSKYPYGAFQKANYKGAEQSTRMRRLVCAFVVRKSRRHVFWRRGTTAISTRKSFPDLFGAAPIGTVSSREFNNVVVRNEKPHINRCPYEENCGPLV